MYHAGDTIRLWVSFKDFGGEAVEPDEVTLNIYNSRRELLESIAALTKMGVGEYHYDYPTAEKEAQYVYEFAGEIGGKPIVERAMISTSWV